MKKKILISSFIIFCFILNQSYIFSFSNQATPLISEISYSPNFPSHTDIITIKAKINTEIVNHSLLFYRIDKSNWKNKSLLNDYLNYFYSKIGPFKESEIVDFYFLLNLHNGSIYIENNNSRFYTIEIQKQSDINPPIIQNVSYNYTIKKDAMIVSVKSYIYDESGIKKAVVYYRINYGTWFSKSMNKNNQDEYEISFSLKLELENIIHFYILAIDNSTNENISYSKNGDLFEIIYSEKGTKPPEIVSILISPKNPTCSDQIKIEVEVKAYSEMKIIFLYYFYNETWIVTPMNKKESDSFIYFSYIGAFSEGSVINYYFVLIDNSNPNYKVTSDNNGKYYHIYIQQQTEKVTFFFVFPCLVMSYFLILKKKFLKNYSNDN